MNKITRLNETLSTLQPVEAELIDIGISVGSDETKTDKKEKKTFKKKRESMLDMIQRSWKRKVNELVSNHNDSIYSGSVDGEHVKKPRVPKAPKPIRKRK